MVSDLLCPKCKKEYHPCSLDAHTEKCDISYPTIEKPVTELKPNQVFVFGSNGGGFHGAGAAGLACRGESKNTWRQDLWFQEAMKAPAGSTKRIGKWAVYGVARGYQEGLQGRSYAVETIKQAGQRRSVSLTEIFDQLVELFQFATDHPELEFLCCITGGGYNGYSVAEMKNVYCRLFQTLDVPSNILFLKEMIS